MENGIDVSHFNGQIDWPTVAQDQDISFVFIKATQGTTYVDPMLSANASGAKNAGLKTGYYHFATLNSADVAADASAEASFFTATISKLPKPDLPLVLDIEANQDDLPPTAVLTWINSFFSGLQEHGYSDYALYSYTPFLNANLPSNHNLGSVRLWIAAYVNQPAPVLPAGWENYWIWQYSSSGNIAGISGNVDLDKTPTPL